MPRRFRRSSTSSGGSRASARSPRSESRSISSKPHPRTRWRLARSITEAKDRITWCRRCFNISEGELCVYCLDDRRDATQLCVVQDPRDIVAVERTHEFRGRYHVLQGAISPIQGIGPEQLRIKELLQRVADEGITEVILATNPDIEGDATAMFVARALKELDVQVSRIASGLPVGGDLEYADEVTLGRALEGRRLVTD